MPCPSHTHGGGEQILLPRNSVCSTGGQASPEDAGYDANSPGGSSAPPLGDPSYMPGGEGEEPSPWALQGARVFQRKRA